MSVLLKRIFDCLLNKTYFNPLNKILIKFREKVRYLKRCKIGNIEFVMDVESEKTLFHANTAASAEPHTIEWIDKFVSPGDNLYDIGANVGVYSLYTAKKYKGSVKVFSFEPEALNFAQLNRNVYSNNFQDTVRTHCLAISNKTELGIMNLERWRVGGTLHQFNRAKDHLDNHFVPVYKQGVLGITLDDLVIQFGLPVPNHIKIDVDGIEDLVVLGAERVLSDKNIKTIHIEISSIDGMKCELITSKLANKGFEIDNIVDHSNIVKKEKKQNIIRSVDYTFIRKVSTKNL